MRIGDSAKTAVQGLRHAKIRSFLTMLGIVIGISSVILLMSIGTSAQRLILGQVESIGSNLIFVIPGATKGSRLSPPQSVMGIVIKTLVKEDFDSFKREPTVSRVAAEIHGSGRVVFENNDVSVTYTGVTGDYFNVINLELAQGTAITDGDVDASNRVVMLGPELAKTLFGERNPVGKSVRLKNLSFRVVGVLERKGLGPFGADFDNMAFLPISVAQRQLLGVNHYGTIVVQAKDSYSIEFTQSRLTSIIRQNHKITDPDKDDFTIRTQEDALDILGNITSILTLFLTSIAFISLLVGGIGIMNIMLVSVVERTREIGLRKAVGATNGDILQQFLFEAMMLTGAGGAVGTLAGSGIAWILALILSQALSSGWVFALPLSSIFIAVGVSAAVGLIFGIYPARVAAKKNPIDALRYE